MGKIENNGRPQDCGYGNIKKPIPPRTCDTDFFDVSQLTDKLWTDGTNQQQDTLTFNAEPHSLVSSNNAFANYKITFPHDISENSTVCFGVIPYANIPKAYSNERISENYTQALCTNKKAHSYRKDLQGIDTCKGLWNFDKGLAGKGFNIYINVEKV